MMMMMMIVKRAGREAAHMENKKIQAKRSLLKTKSRIKPRIKIRKVAREKRTSMLKVAGIRKRINSGCNG